MTSQPLEHIYSLSNVADWNDRVSHILTDVCASLGVPRPAAEVSAELHKLLLYKPGSFFKRHTDSEKVACCSCDAAVKLILVFVHERMEDMRAARFQ